MVPKQGNFRCFARMSPFREKHPQMKLEYCFISVIHMTNGIFKLMEFQNTIACNHCYLAFRSALNVPWYWNVFSFCIIINIYSKIINVYTLISDLLASHKDNKYPHTTSTMFYIIKWFTEMITQTQIRFQTKQELYQYVCLCYLRSSPTMIFLSVCIVYDY